MAHAPVEELVSAIAAKDLSTAAHTWRVVLYARAMAEAAGLSNDLVERLTHAAALHDVGKLAVPDHILQKPAKLTAEEFEIIKGHAAAGHARVIEMGETDELVLGLVRHHHERIDGSGYPDRLRGHEIPEAARYFAVIDSFDAMTSIRPYRMEVGEAAAERALTELAAHTEDWYCKDSVAMFTDLYRTGSLAWIMEFFNDRCPLPTHHPKEQVPRRYSELPPRAGISDKVDVWGGESSKLK